MDAVEQECTSYLITKAHFPRFLGFHISFWKMAYIEPRNAPTIWYDDMMIFAYLCILNLNVIFKILESCAFKEYGTCWVFQAL